MTEIAIWASGVQASDASGTGLLNLTTRQWDPEVGLPQLLLSQS